jgi:hypothetical protein
VLLAFVVYAGWRHRNVPVEEASGNRVKIFLRKHRQLIHPLVGTGIMFAVLHFGKSALSRSPREYLRVGVGTVVVFLFSSLLFQLKVRKLRTYAYLEVIFALAVCAQTLKTMGDTIQPIQMFGLMTSSYLIIRGFDNLRKAREARLAAMLEDMKKKFPGEGASLPHTAT